MRPLHVMGPDIFGPRSLHPSYLDYGNHDQGRPDYFTLDNE
jgi:hypothetical protein